MQQRVSSILQSRRHFERNNLFDVHRALRNQNQLLASFEVRQNHSREILVFLHRQIQILTLLESFLIEKRERDVVVVVVVVVILVVALITNDVDELVFVLGDERAHHRERRGRNEFVLSSADEEVFRDDSRFRAFRS